MNENQFHQKENKTHAVLITLFLETTKRKKKKLKQEMHTQHLYFILTIHRNYHKMKLNIQYL